MDEAKSIALKLEKIGKKAYIVGGYCRDKILGRPLWDIDMCTDATPDEMRQVLDVVWEIGSKYGTLIIKEWDKSIEITTFRKDIWSVNNRKPAEVQFTDSLEEDALRRDFTMNAIYYDVLLNEYIDPTDWIKDLLEGKIRFVWNAVDRLEEDILRGLRFVRLKNKYSLAALDDDIQAIKENISLLQNVSSNRIKRELDKMLLDRTNVTAITDLRRINFIWEVFSYVTISDTIERFERLNNAEITDVDIYYAAIFINIQFYEDYLLSMPFSNKSKKKIRQIIKNFENLYFYESLIPIERAKLFVSDYFEESFVLLRWYKIEEDYNHFKEMLSYVELPTGSDIVKDYPDLKGREIKDKLEEETNKLLISLM